MFLSENISKIGIIFNEKIGNYVELYWLYYDLCNAILHICIFDSVKIEKIMDRFEKTHKKEENRNELVKQISLLAFGCERLFKHDLENDTKNFQPIFNVFSNM